MQRFFDKKGIRILDGDTIYNPFDKNPRQKVEKIQGELWFGAEGTTLSTEDNDWCVMKDVYGFDKFWEVVQ